MPSQNSEPPCSPMHEKPSHRGCVSVGARQERTGQVAACAPCCVWQRTPVSRRHASPGCPSTRWLRTAAVGETQLLTLGDGFPLRAWLS